MTPRRNPTTVPLSRRHVATAGLPGVAAVAIGAWLLPWQLAVVVGWCVFAVVWSVKVWVEIGGRDADQTRALATREDPTRAQTASITVLAAAASLVGAMFSLGEAKHHTGAMEVALTATPILAVVLGWVVVNTTFALHYAHLYYTAPVGGIDFPGGDAPDYHDFAYVAAAVGAAYAVSDTDITQKVMRRVVLRHTLLSYAFGAVIIGMVINILAGLVG